jgi:hypothetical protein
MRAEKSADAVIVHVPGLEDSVENAARLAVAKHMVDTYIAKPLVLKSAPKIENVVALIEQFQANHQIASAAASD